MPPQMTTAMAIANTSYGIKCFPMPKLIAHNVQRVWPDPGLHPLSTPQTRWAIAVYSYASYGAALSSVAIIRAYNRNNPRNLLNVDLEAAGLVNIVSIINNW